MGNNNEGWYRERGIDKKVKEFVEVVVNNKGSSGGMEMNKGDGARSATVEKVQR